MNFPLPPPPTTANKAFPLQLIIVTGTSGSGKTQALKCLEDLGFFCVDNLPPALFQKFTELCLQPEKDVKKVALGIDIRERAFLDDLFANLGALHQDGCHVELLFLEAQNDVLVRRFSESRRPHPLLPQRPIIEGIQLERERLQGLREKAQRIVDTSEFTVHDLKAWMIAHYRDQGEGQSLRINLLSFGFKFGVPIDVDLMFDVRFLRNPHFVPELQPLTGAHHDIQHFIFDTKEGAAFLQHIKELLAFLLPLFEREQRSHLTIAFGCTGGRHRSVAMAIRIKEELKGLGYEASIRHREIQNEKVPV